jgi:subfamily B ATP-binding cassette protein MsbA
MGEGQARRGFGALLRRLWAYLMRYRTKTFAVIAVGALESFFTKAPLLVASVVMNLLFRTSEDQRPKNDWVTRQAGELKTWLFGQRELVADEKFNTLLALAMLICVLSLLGAACMALFTYGSRMLSTRVVLDLKEEVTRHLLSLSMRFFSGKRMGDLLSRVTNDTTTVMQSFNLTLENVIQDPFMILGSVWLLWFVDPWFAIAALVVIPAIGLPLVMFGRGIRRSSEKSLKAMGDSTETLTQMLSGIRTVKAFHLEQQQLRQFSEANADFLERTKQLMRKRSRAQAVTFLGYSVGFAALVLAIGAWALKQGNAVHAGDLLLTLSGISTAYPSIKRLARSYQVLQESAGALDRMEEILRMENDVAERPGALTTIQVRGRVEFDHVSFAYDQEQVLRDISFTVEPGQTVALVGPSGAGKSTTLDLVARFYDPTSGVVRVDGHDLRDLSVAAWRSHLAVVSQSPFLFNTSIGENIRHGRPGATEAEVVAAARAANIHEFIQALPEGYATSVGERGSKLSGGQLQRITIARAILRNASILLLDEATSALDSESEDAVQRALVNLMRGRTSFVIAHRLATVRKADRILVMEAGRIVQDDRHEILVTRDGLYKRMHDLQALRS